MNGIQSVVIALKFYSLVIHSPIRGLESDTISLAKHRKRKTSTSILGVIPRNVLFEAPIHLTFTTVRISRLVPRGRKLFLIQI